LSKLQQRWIFFKQYSVNQNHKILYVLLARGDVQQFNLLLQHEETCLWKWWKSLLWCGGCFLGGGGCFGFVLVWFFYSLTPS